MSSAEVITDRAATITAITGARVAALPKLAVIIPALNEEETIGTVVAAIPRTIPGVGAVGVIVVDGAPRAAAAERARPAGCDVVATPPRRRGLGDAFKDGVNEALRAGASIVVN